MANVTINDLYGKYRAAGVYTVYQDDTVAPAINGGDIVRLVYGFSSQGPFNRPVLIQRNDFETATRVFGPIDKKLERNKSFFHRSLMVCLEEGPVLALNLLKLYNQEEGGDYPADKVPYRAFSMALGDANSSNTQKLYSSYFNKQRFWSPSREYLLATRDVSDDHILSLVNLSKTPCSFLIKKSDVAGLDITVREWYGNSEIPSYLRPDDYISDYFIDVYVIDGNFGPDRYEQLSGDPVYGAYFNQKGLIASQMDAFIARSEINVRSIYTGTIIPGFRDRQNTRYYIEDIINSRFDTDGILCGVDVNQLDEFEFGTNTKGLDLVGHSLIGSNLNEVDMLSYKSRIAQDLSYDQQATKATMTVSSLTGYSVVSQKGKLTVTVDDSNPNFNDLETNISLNSLVNGAGTAAGTAAGITIANPALVVSRLVKNTSSIVFDLTCDFKLNETSSSGSFVDIDIQADALTLEYGMNRLIIDPTDTFYLADVKSPIYLDWVDGELTDGDKVYDGTDYYYLKFDLVKADGGLDVADDYRDLLKVSLFTDAELTTAIGAGAIVQFGDTYDSFGFPITTSTKLNLISSIGSLNLRIDATSGGADNKVLLDIAADISYEDYLVGYDENDNEILTKILSIVRVDTDDDTVVDSIMITTANKIKMYSANSGSSLQVERFKRFTTLFDTYNLTHQAGFVIGKHHMPDGTNERMKSIVEVMTAGSIRNAMIDPDIVSYRYLVDTFANGLEPNSKGYVSRIAADRQVSMALLNAPMVEEFEDSSDPRFTDTPTQVDPVQELNIKFIKDGGNRDENPTFLYTMPSEADGASWAAFFFPEVRILENGSSYAMPPAPFVSNNFIRKFRNGEPFKPVANKRRGTVTSSRYQVSGLSYLLTAADRGHLEAKGINPLKQNSDGTVVVFGNQTAFQSFRSVLNNLHVRDMLITLQVDIENLLTNYLFEFNNDAIRLEVGSLVRNYLENIQNSYDSIAFFDVIIDRNNNRQEIIRENVAILDVIIEPTDVATRYINRITLVKNGQPAVGGFVAI